jgi:hypothetical protein
MIFNERGAGWVGFAAIMFMVLGVWNIFQGIVAFFRSGFWTETGAHYIWGDLRTWAWIIIIWGVIELLAAGSIASGGQWGRLFGVVVAAIAVILQMWYLPVYPFWAIIAIAIQVMIIYGLVAYGGKRPVA